MNMQYRIVTGSTTIELEKNVKTYIEMGFIPQGGISVENFIMSGSGKRYLQAMIKTTKTD